MSHDVGKFIRTRLKIISRKQCDLADYCEVSDNAVAKWIRTGQISRENAIKTAKFLHCSMDELLGRDFSKDEYVRQLLYFFDGLTLEHKDDLLYQAQRWHAIDNPEDKLSNPFSTKPKPADSGIEQ